MDTTAQHAAPPSELDAVLMSVLANRFDAIAREMTSTLQRAAYSPVLSLARDFSCSIVTADNQLFACAEGLPIHIFGSHLQAASMTELHEELEEGDAFLHNDPYLGGSHPGDHTILVPVLVDGTHAFTAVVKGHQSDIGNALPTTYMPTAQDTYAEGGLILPCIRVQKDYEDVPDVIRLCRTAIRVPDQWYGDYLAMVAAARVCERRIGEVVEKYGMPLIREFVEAWLDYSETRMAHAIGQLPSGEWIGEGRHDPFPGIPDGMPLQVRIRVDAEAGRAEVDLRDNPDCIDSGSNSSEACSACSAIQGVMSAVESDVPHNSGAFRRIDVLLREGCVIGIPVFPHSCSLATTNPAFRMINLTQSTFAQIDDGWGLAEGGIAQTAGMAVVSGTDRRRGGAPFINQFLFGNNGGPASPVADGWMTYSIVGVCGLMNRDSVEIQEQKFPILVRSLELELGTGGAGRFRGSPGMRTVFGPRFDPMTVTFPTDGFDTPPRGVRGGHDGGLARTWRITADGKTEPLPAIFVGTLEPGEWVAGVDNGGGGYGDPLDRTPALVLHDLSEGWITEEEAGDVYGVVVVTEDGLPARVDDSATERRRAELRAGRQ